jgi:hypothetical protein
MQRELRGFADRTDEEQQSDQASRGETQETAWDTGKSMQDLFREDCTESKRPGGVIKIHNAQQHEHIADACRHERLDSRIPC